MTLSAEELHQYELAYMFKRPVYELLGEMPFDEYLKWGEYLERRPEGWRDDARAYTVLSALGVKQKPEALFDTLRKLKEAGRASDDGKVSAASLKQSAFFMNMLKAVGGDRIDLST